MSQHVQPVVFEELLRVRVWLAATDALAAHSFVAPLGFLLGLIAVLRVGAVVVYGGLIMHFCA